MSDTFLRLIPTRPEFVPSNESSEAAAGKLRELMPNADRIEVIRFEEIQFVDQGGNFERVLCPECGADVTERFSEWMETAFRSGFKMRNVSLPCCGKDADLNDLDWQWPAGFATFMLEAMNPQLPGWLPDDDRRDLEAILGCDIRQIYSHY